MRADQKEITNWLSKTIGDSSFNIKELRQEASDRKYYRIKAKNISYVLTDNFDKTDQSANFLYASKILKNRIKIDIKYFIKNSLHLHANVRAQKIKFSSLEIFKNLIKFIIFPGKIWINIHIEAIKLWIKKNVHFPKLNLFTVMTHF